MNKPPSSMDNRVWPSLRRCVLRSICAMALISCCGIMLFSELLQAQNPTVDSLRILVQAVYSVSEHSKGISGAHRHSVQGSSSQEFKRSSEQHHQDSLNAALLNKFARAFWEVNIDSARLYAIKALAFARQVGVLSEELRSYEILANVLRRMDQSVLALRYFDTLLVRATASSNYVKMAAALSGMATTYQRYGQFDKALSYHLKVIDVLQYVGDSSNAAVPFIYLSEMFIVQKQYALAIDYARQGLGRAEQFHNGIHRAQLLGNISEALVGLHLLDSAMAVSNQALRQAQETGNKEVLALIFTQRGRIYYTQHNYTNALTSYMSALQTQRSLGKAQGDATVWNGIGLCYFQQGNYAKAMDCAQRALETSYLSVREERRRAYVLLADVHAAQGNAQEAFTALKAASALQDSIYNENTLARTLDLQADYENRLRTRQLEILQQEQQNNRRILMILITASLLLLAVSTIAMWRFVRERRAQRALAERESWLRQVQQISKILSFEIDIETLDIYWRNEHNQFVKGTTLHTLTPEGAFEPIHPDDVAKLQQLALDVANAVDFHKPPTFTYRSLCPDGSYRTFFSEIWMPSAVGSRQAATRRVVGFAQDISDRRRIEEELSFSEQKLQAMFNSMQDAYLLIDREYRILAFNTAAALRAKDMHNRRTLQVGDNMLDHYLAPIFHLGFRQSFERALKGEQVIAERFFISPITNEPTWIEARYLPVVDSNKSVFAVSLVIADITERKTAEEQLLLSEQKLSAFFNSSRDVYILVNRHHEVIAFNRTAQQETKALGKELQIGMNLLDAQSGYIPSDFSEQFTALFEQALAGEPATLETRLSPLLSRKPEERRWASIRLQPAFNNHNEIFAVSLVMSDITERKTAEIERLRSEQKLQALFNSTTDAYFLLGKNHEILAFNRAAAEGIAAGSGRRVAVGDDLLLYALPNTQEQFLANFHRALQGERIAEEIKVSLLDGTLAWMDTQYLPVYDETNAILGVSLNITDRTQQRLAEMQRRLLESVVIKTQDAVVITAVKPTREDAPEGAYAIVYVNEAFCKLTGYTAEELQGKNPRILQGKNTNQPALQAIRAALREHKPISTELVNCRKDGTEYLVDVSISPVFSDDGVLTHWVSVQRDVTEQRAVERRVRSSEEQLRGLVANIPGAVYRYASDKNFTCVFLSETFKQISGYPASEFLFNAERSIMSIIHPVDTERVRAAIQESLELEEGYELEYRIFHKYGSIRWLHERGRGVYNDSGELQYLDGVLFDITARKLVEERLRESEEFLTSILNAIPNPIFVKDRQHRWIVLNDANVRLIGAPREQLLGKSDYDFFPKEQADVFWYHDEQTFEQGYTINEEAVTVGSEVRTFITQKTVGTTAQGNRYLVGVMLDITELKRAEGELRQSKALLSQAQQIAKIGSWYITFATQELVLSPELQRLLELPVEYERSLTLPLKEALVRFVPSEQHSAIIEQYQRGIHQQSNESYFTEFELCKRKLLLVPLSRLPCVDISLTMVQPPV